MKRKLIIQILDYIDNHLFGKITIQELSDSFHYNRDYIMRLFKKELNISIIDYINHKKIYLSLEAFYSQNNSILKIAILYGYTSQEYYSEMFKRIIGVNPITYRRFIQYDHFIPINQQNLIRSNLVELKYLIDSINEYRVMVVRKSCLTLSLYK